MASLDSKTIFNMLKHAYSTPEAELLGICLEQNYLASNGKFNKDENTETFIQEEDVDA